MCDWKVPENSTAVGSKTPTATGSLNGKKASR